MKGGPSPHPNGSALAGGLRAPLVQLHRRVVPRTGGPQVREVPGGLRLGLGRRPALVPPRAQAEKVSEYSTTYFGTPLNTFVTSFISSFFLFFDAPSAVSVFRGENTLKYTTDLAQLLETPVHAPRTTLNSMDAGGRCHQRSPKARRR